ncbi:MAG: AbrB family transcriptional regulator [Beijerinckiaceae bacterium]
MNSSFAPIRHQVETLAAGVAGAFAFNLVSLPAASLCGAMIAVAMLMMTGRTVELDSRLRDFGFLLAGIGMGAAVTPDMLQGLSRYPVSLAIFAASLVITVVVTQAILRKLTGMDRATAVLSAMPGALSMVLAVAAETPKANVAQITLIQSVRLFALVTLLPTIVAATGATGALPATVAMSPQTLIIVLSAGLALSWLLDRLKLAAAWIFGGMMASAVAHGGGWATGVVPGLLNEAAFMLVGVYIGIRFSAIRLAALKELLGVALLALAAGVIVAVGAAWLAASLGVASFEAALLAYVPGALEAMIVLGGALGLDPIFVGLHHLSRFFGISLLLPFLANWLRRS